MAVNRSSTESGAKPWVARSWLSNAARAVSCDAFAAPAGVAAKPVATGVATPTSRHDAKTEPRMRFIESFQPRH